MSKLRVGGIKHYDLPGDSDIIVLSGTDSAVSINGNLTANTFFGDGSQLTGISSYDSAKVQGQIDSDFPGIDDNATNTILTLSGSSTTNNSLVTELASNTTSGYYIGSDSNGLEAYLHPLSQVGSTLRLKSGGNTILSHNEVEDAIYLRTNNADRLFIKGSGEVGIGTLNPNTFLHVYNDADSDEQIIIAETFGDYSRGTGISFRLDGTEMGRVNAHETRGMTFYATDSVGNAATERMRIDTNGNVGIGTTSPNQLLTLGSNTGSTTIGLDFETTNVSRGSILYNSGSGEMAFTSGYSGYGGFMTFDCNGAERMRIDANGNVGIGDTNPTSTLSVDGSISEKQYNLTGTSIDPDNGTIQYVTLTGNVTYTSALNSGEYVTLMIDDGSSYTITWPTITWVGGSAPTLATSGYNVIELWRVNGTLYGAFVGVA